MRRFFLATVFSHGDFRFRLRQAGYSLYELMITSGVVSVLGAGAIGMTGTIQDARMTSEVNQLMGHLNLARSEAIKRGHPVTMCKSNTGTNCTKSSHWRDGWIVFADKNEKAVVNAGDEMIFVQQRLPGNITLRYGGGKASEDYVTYYPLGYARPNATFAFCDSRGSQKAKSSIMGPTGRPRSHTKDGDNKTIDCSKNAS